MVSPSSTAAAAASLVGYVVGTQMRNTVKVRVPRERYLAKYQKSIIRHRNYLAHDETGKCLVGDVVRIQETPRFSALKSHAVAEIVKPAERFICPETKYVYTNGHLSIPVGYVADNGQMVNRLTKEQYKQMGLL